MAKITQALTRASEAYDQKTFQSLVRDLDAVINKLNTSIALPIRFLINSRNIEISNRFENTFAIIRYNGVPGGWGTPNVYEHSINSPQSQKEVVGAIVIRYKISEATKATSPNILFIFLYIIF